MSTIPNPDPAPGTSPAFIPLEANPELMTTLLHKLGLSSALQIHDVYSLTDPDLLAFIPRPALALLLVFPVSATYESHRLAEDALLEEYKGKGDAEPVVWFRQTIRNACGLMGLLHAVANGPARDYIEKPSDLDSLLSRALPLPPAERAQLLERSESLASAHREAASQGATSAPEATDDVDLHYVCFVKGTDGTLWELDGRRKGPLKRGTLEESEDVLSQKALAVGPLKFLEREGADLRFSAVALAGSTD
ncbi:hypothetical protein ACRALDRAFT_1053389 [Sodiomyces alcalophilus JCM 7366]|uniref:uncharacterized protein n=1 Tax=Sodiomyces alcalophilus JCM 7366 TaxID=591952 RepID=UPI0039B40C47